TASFAVNPASPEASKSSWLQKACPSSIGLESTSQNHCDEVLGRLGVWYSTDKLDGPQLRDFVRTVENNGYSNLWYPESRGYESMSLASWLLSSSEKLVIGSSIANIYARDSFTAQRAMVSLNALYGNRFVLGLGVSHIPMVEGLRGHRYDKPLSAMSAYLDGINKSAPAGELPVVVAALGPKMLALSAAKSRGAVPYNVTPKHTAEAATILGPSKWLAVEQKITRPIPRKPARSGARSCRATWRCRTTATAGCARVLPRLSSPTAAATGSSMRWCCGATPTRSNAACGSILRLAPRMSACSPSMPTAISPPAIACWPRSPIPERVPPFRAGRRRRCGSGASH
ncbi:MAG: LLM class flavin-dependent oxidoreductase, partial [Bradyrhizobium sp.]|nr:LLM class flavin-dependent oxidoreductase [Bradyrhizobium sp.]